MARTVLHKLGTDLRFQVAFVLLAFAISSVVGLVTERLGAAGLVLCLFALVAAGAKLQHEKSLDR